MLTDLRFALRLFQRNPGPVLLCTLALALGIGANTALYSVLQTVLLKPLAYQDPDRLMVLAEKPITDSKPGESVSPANYLDWRRDAHHFSQLGAAVSWAATLTGAGDPEEVAALQVTPNLFPLLGATPLLGRGFDLADNGPRAVLLSYGLWQRRFAGDRQVVGRTLILSGQPFLIAGVMPHDFRFAPYWATRSQLWVNLRFDADFSSMRRARMLRVFGRLAPGVTSTQAAAEMTAIATRLSLAYPEDNAETTISVTPLNEKVVGRVRLALIVLMGAAGLVLLIACASAAHLLLARAAARQQELAVRLALGASRWQIIRQMVTESLLLSVVAAFAGILLANFALQALTAGLQQADDFALLPRFDEISIDRGVLTFTLLLATVTGILFGATPAWFGARTGIGPLHSRGEVARAGSRGFTVTAQVALAQVLLIGALLLARSFWNLQQVDPGFTPAQVLAANVRVTGGRDATSLITQMVEHAGNLPGVESASATNHLPLAGDVWTFDITLEGRPTPPAAQAPSAIYRLSLPRYFETMGASLSRGRDFTPADRAGAPPVAIVNEVMAKRYWPNEDALGKRFRLGSRPDAKPSWITIVGVSHNLKQGEWAAAVAPEMHLCALQPPSGFGSNSGTSMTLVVRSRLDPATLSAALRAAVWQVDATVPVSNETTLARAVASSVWRPRLNTLLLGSFAALALLLALIGVYGVVSFAVTERRAEIGLRMALGADAGRVARLVILHALRLVAVGLIGGWAAAWALTRWLEGMLYQVPVHDTTIFALVPALLVFAAVVAAAWPAWRATRLDPLECLR